MPGGKDCTRAKLGPFGNKTVSRWGTNEGIEIDVMVEQGLGKCLLISSEKVMQKAAESGSLSCQPCQARRVHDDLLDLSKTHTFSNAASNSQGLIVVLDEKVSI